MQTWCRCNLNCMQCFFMGLPNPTPNLAPHSDVPNSIDCIISGITEICSLSLHHQGCIQILLREKHSPRGCHSFMTLSLSCVLKGFLTGQFCKQHASITPLRWFKVVSQIVSSDSVLLALDLKLVSWISLQERVWNLLNLTEHHQRIWPQQVLSGCLWTCQTNYQRSQILA